MAENHGEETEPPPGGAYGDGAISAPVHLGAFPCGEVQHQVGGFAEGTHLADEPFEEGIAAGIALRTHLLEELLGGIGMTFQKRDDPGFKGVEFAGALGLFALLVNGTRDPLLDGLEIELQFLGDLRGIQAFLLMELAQAAEGFVGNHFPPPSKTWRKISPTERTSPVRVGRAMDGAASSWRDETW